MPSTARAVPTDILFLYQRDDFRRQAVNEDGLLQDGAENPTRALPWCSAIRAVNRAANSAVPSSAKPVLSAK
jgi:hypothetical protein